jgi:hypothetical protein
METLPGVVRLCRAITPTRLPVAKYLYKTGEKYAMVPIGIAIGAALVTFHRIVVVVSVPCKA